MTNEMWADETRREIWVRSVGDESLVCSKEEIMRECQSDIDAWIDWKKGRDEREREAMS